MISGTYTHLLSGTVERRKHLKYGKLFDCCCERCTDPTELGTYFGALLCSQSGCGGFVISTNSLDPTNNADFACNKCKFSVSNFIELNINFELIIFVDIVRSKVK